MTSYLKHGLELFGATFTFGGMLAAVYLSSTAHPPLYGRISGFAVAVGIALLISRTWLYGPDNAEEEEALEEEPATKALGVIAGFVGILLFPAGVLTATDYQLVAVSGFVLFISGVVLVGASERWEVSENSDTVPDDPTEILDETNDET